MAIATDTDGIANGIIGQSGDGKNSVAGLGKSVDGAAEGMGAVDKADADKVTTQLKLAENVEAPVEVGQKLGTMTVFVDGVEQQVIDIVAEEAVARLSVGGIFSRFMNLLFMRG